METQIPVDMYHQEMAAHYRRQEDRSNPECDEGCRYD